MFYVFKQNNSGGRFDFDRGRGVSCYVVVEAATAEEANECAESLGIYFDEDFDVDCECCGQRWYPVVESDGTVAPELYGVPVEGFKFSWRWMGEDPEVFVHYLDGRVEEF